MPPQHWLGSTFLADVWTFYCPLNGSAHIRVDTLGSSDAPTSPVDPAFMVTFDSMLAWPEPATGDDDFACSFAPQCGYSCPEATYNCVDEGVHTLLVYTFADRGCGFDQGRYMLSVEVFDGLDGAGLALPASEVALGGQEPTILYEWGGLPAGPAANDHWYPWTGPPPEPDEAKGPLGARKSH